MDKIIAVVPKNVDIKYVIVDVRDRDREPNKFMTMRATEIVISAVNRWNYEQCRDGEPCESCR